MLLAIFQMSQNYPTKLNYLVILPISLQVFQRYNIQSASNSESNCYHVATAGNRKLPDSYSMLQLSLYTFLVLYNFRIGINILGYQVQSPSITVKQAEYHFQQFKNCPRSDVLLQPLTNSFQKAAAIPHFFKTFQMLSKGDRLYYLFTE